MRLWSIALSVTLFVVTFTGVVYAMLGDTQTASGVINAAPLIPVEVTRVGGTTSFLSSGSGPSGQPYTPIAASAVAAAIIIAIVGWYARRSWLGRRSGNLPGSASWWGQVFRDVWDSQRTPCDGVRPSGL